jgi:hypothetical protein
MPNRGYCSADIVRADETGTRTKELGVDRNGRESGRDELGQLGLVREKGDEDDALSLMPLADIGVVASLTADPASDAGEEKEVGFIGVRSHPDSEENIVVEGMPARASALVAQHLWVEVHRNADQATPAGTIVVLFR